MRRFAQCGVLLCVAVEAAALVSCSHDAKPAREEVDRNGSVAVKGERGSPFASDYLTAEDLLAKGKLLEAEGLYRELTNKEPNSPHGYMWLATCRAMRNDSVGARRLYEQALVLQPGLVPALVGIGSSYYAEYDYTDSIASYKAALALDEGCPEAHYGLAIAYACWGRPTQARIHLERYRRLVPDSPKIPVVEDAIRRSPTESSATPNAAPPHQ